MIRWLTVFIDRPAPTFDAARDFWLAATGTTPSATRGEHDEFATLVPSIGDACLRIQRTLDGSAGSHLDVHVDDVRATAADAERFGAITLHDTATDGLVVMRSPGGLKFCVVEHHGERSRPAPIGFDGRRALVDQVSVDTAPDRFDDECRFWSALTGWELGPGYEPEYALLARPEGQPYRFLLQRRGDGDRGLATEAHLDIACDDIDAAVADHVGLGALLVDRRRWWAIMTDPSAVRYCLTGRDPDTGLAAGAS